jgi:hypothetical protein
MPRKAKPALRAGDIQGLKYLRAIDDLLDPLREVPAHGNRQFFMDQYVALLLLYFFNPVLTSLRSLQQATGLENVQAVLGVKRTSLGAMSESAAKVFDPERLVPIVQQVIDQLAPLPSEATWEKLPGTLRAMDGTFLRCLPKMVWAVFRQQSDHRGVRLHLQFDILRGTPVSADVTEALGSEKKVLRQRVQAGAVYLLDRGYIEYALYQHLHDAGAFFVARLKNNSSGECLQAHPLTEQDRAAGVLSDHAMRMGSAFTEGDLVAPVRRIVVRGEGGQRDVILLTNLDLPAEGIAALYRYRWQVELFFRWFKCVLGCTHWVSQTRSGLTLQVYVALLASVLIRLWTGRRPTKRTFEMICLYFQGWARAEELAAHIESLQRVS